MLETRALVKHFGGVAAVDGVDLRVDPGEIRCVIGPNGAGKSTLFNLLTGTLRPTSGQVLLRDRRIDGMPVHRITHLGVSRKFQVPAVFEELSVLENLQVAAAGTRPLRALFRHRTDRDEAVAGVLDEIGLADDAAMPAGLLAHGQVQWLEIGMVLVNSPSVLLLDEPTAGMTVAETRRTADLVRAIVRQRGLTAVVVEHDIDFIRVIGDRVTVLHKGRVLADGSVAEIERDPEVRRVYLGSA